MKTTPIVRSWSADSLSKDFVMDEAAKKFTADSLIQALKDRGITMDESVMSDPKVLATMKSLVTKDSALALGSANIPAYLQFFQYFRPEVIRALYRGRTAAQTFGVDTVGDWTTEKIIVQFLELTGDVDLYDDFARGTLSNYNIGYDTVDTVRFEANLEVTKLEEATASVMRQNAHQLKKDSVILNVDIFSNNAFWYGVNIGGKKIEGVLNNTNFTNKTHAPVDPVAAGTTVLQIQNMINTWIGTLATNLAGNFDVQSEEIRILCPLKWVTAFSKATDSFGWSAKKWLAENYKNVKLSFHPELDDAGASGRPMAIVYAPNVDGVGMKTVSLQQTSALRLIGAIPTLKGMQESYSASVAGSIIACPLAIAGYETPDIAE